MLSNFVLHLSKLVSFILIYCDILSVFMENGPLVKFIRNHTQDLSGVFSISSLVRISMILLISSLSLTLYLNSLVYDSNIFGSSSKVFGNWQSAILGNFQEMFGKSSEIGRKSSENHQSRLISNCLYNKKNILFTH